jgi:hypothetical protein
MKLILHQNSYILYVESTSSNDGYFCYSKLFDTSSAISRIPSNKLKIVIDFNYCTFLDHLGVAFLGGLIHLIRDRQGDVTFKWHTLSSKIRMNLAQNGFLQEFSENTEPWDGNSIPFRHDFDLTSCNGGILPYLENQWLGRGWINISNRLKESIISTISEIYLNAFEHSQTPIGVFSCGQHYPNEKRLELTAIDFGVGIVSNVRSVPKYKTVSAEKALQWAFQQGNSTKAAEVSRGNGLSALQNFIIQNKGILMICTNDGQVKISDNGVEYSSNNKHFSGTLVNIVIQCDESKYCLSNEN